MYLSAAVRTERALQRQQQQQDEERDASVRSNGLTTSSALADGRRASGALVTVPGVSSGALRTVSRTENARPRVTTGQQNRDGRRAGGFTGQDDRLRTSAAIPLELVGVVAAAQDADKSQLAVQNQGPQRRVSQPMMRPLTDPRLAQRRRLQRESRSGTDYSRLSATARDDGDDETTSEDDDDDDLLLTRSGATAANGATGVDDADDGNNDEEAVSTGTVISPNTVVCALATSAARELVRGLHRQPHDTNAADATGQLSSSSSSPSPTCCDRSFTLPMVMGGLVLTAECGGWLRVRGSQTGTVQHQQQLRGGHEASCCTWLVTSGGVGSYQCRLWAACGLLGGQLCFYEVTHDTLRAWPRLTPVTVHDGPVVSLVPMYSVSARNRKAPSSSSSPKCVTLVSFLVSMDAGGQLVLWQLSEGGHDSHHNSMREKREAKAARDRHRRPRLTCVAFATVDWSAPDEDAEEEMAEASGAGTREGGGACGPPVLATATCLNPTAFLLNQPLAPRGTDTVATTTTVCLYVCSPTFLSRQQRSEDPEEGEEEAEASEVTWWQLARVYAGVDRARDGVIVSLHAIASGGVPTRHEDTAVAAVATSHATVPVPISSGQVWAGTSGGVVCVWEANTTYMLRRIPLPSASPAHALSSTRLSGGSASWSAGAGMPHEVWACQLDGSVTAWHTHTFQLNQALPLSYPPLHPHGRTTERDTTTTAASQDADGSVHVRDATDLAWALYGSPSLAPTAAATAKEANGRVAGCWLRGARQHFTLALTPLEAVHLRRAWSIATDGSVRTWLIPDNSASHVNDQHPAPPTTTTTTRSSPGDGVNADAESPDSEPPLDPREVRAFLFAVADTMTGMQADYDAKLAAQAEHIRRLEARNRILAEALRRAADTEKEKLDASSSSASDVVKSQSRRSLTSPRVDDSNSDNSADTTKQGAAVRVGAGAAGLDTNLAGAAPGKATQQFWAHEEGEDDDLSHRSRRLSALFNDLRARLEDSLAAEEYLQRRLTANELLSLEESDTGLDGDRARPLPLASPPHPAPEPRTPPPPPALDALRAAEDEEASESVRGVRVPLGANSTRRVSSPAIRTAQSSAAADHTPGTSPIAHYEFFPSPLFDRRGGGGSSGGGGGADTGRTNQPIRSPQLLNAWASKQ